MIPESLALAVYICGGAIALCWALNVITGEHSWVDRSWAILPPIYAWTFALHDGDPRATLMAVVATVWGARLTFNFWRKGGFAPGGEDYRWGILRARLPRWAYEVFNLTFIAGYQNVLLLLFSLPAWVVLASDAPLGPLDWALAVAFLGATLGETIADQHQWSFHQKKKRGEANGFCREGLFLWSRHPNFFFEQAQWWIFLLFPVAAGLGVAHVGAIGAPLLTALFYGSTVFTESITVSKYPAYADYQRTTPMWVPMPPRRE